MIRAIETTFKGYRFRSRLEARWAIFLDAIGVEWRYEPEGFELSDGTAYLPDFWIPLAEKQRPYPQGTPPERGFWVEIKPTDPTDKELERCLLLSKASGHCVYLVAGNVGPEEYTVFKWHPSGGAVRPVAGVHPDDMPVNSDWLLSYLMEAIPPVAADNPINYQDPYGYRRAFAAARSARFEHGESP